MNALELRVFVVLGLFVAGCSSSQAPADVPDAPPATPAPERAPHGDFLPPALASCCLGTEASAACDRRAFDELKILCPGDLRIASEAGAIIGSKAMPTR